MAKYLCNPLRYVPSVPSVPSVAVLLALVLAQAARSDDPINYEQHALPVFREFCLGCHDGEKQKGGLSLETYASAMAGGAGGEVIYGGELESSRLWALINHEDEPKMPPNRDRLPDDKLQIIRQWIEQGALERSDSPVAKPQPVQLATVVDEEIEDDTPGAMPENLSREPVIDASVPGAVLAMAASPRAPLLAVGHPKHVQLIHLDTRELLGIIPFPEGMPNVLRFSRDGNVLLIAGGRPGHSGNAAVFDVRTGERRLAVGDERDCVLAADLDRSLQRIALGGPSKLVRVFATETSELQYEIRGHIDWVMALEFSPDGKYIASGDRQGMVVVWEADGGGEYQTMQGHAGAVTAVSWGRDSQVFATASEDGTVKLWNVEQSTPVRSWTAHEGGCLDVVFGKEKLVTAGRDRSVRLWDHAGKSLQALPASDDVVLHAVLSHDGATIASGDWLGNVKVEQLAPISQSSQ